MTTASRMPAIPNSRSQRWILAHDIRDPRRLQRVWRYLRKEGLRLQYSVYVLAGSRRQIEQIMEDLRAMIDEQQDDVRVYPLTENSRIWGIGTPFTDGGNPLSDEILDRITVTGPYAIEPCPPA